MTQGISAVISGSFKFKPEIDRTIETLEQTGITVLEPTKGWLIMPKFEVVKRLRHGQIRPLPSEEMLTTREIEDTNDKIKLLCRFTQQGFQMQIRQILRT